MRIEMARLFQCLRSTSSMTSCYHASAIVFSAEFSSSLSASMRAFLFRKWITRAIVGSAFYCAIQSTRAFRRSASATGHAYDVTFLASSAGTSASIDT